MQKLGMVVLLALGAVIGCGSSGDGGGGGSGASGGGGHANGDGALGAPCTVASECTSGLCVGGRCTVSCDDSAACPPAPEWTCALAPGSGTVCQCTPSGEETCDGQDNDCDGQVDDGATCPEGGVCQAGACTCPPENVCASGCVDAMTDPKNCGGCDVVCPPESTCSAGECACAAGKLVCDGACTDVQANAAHCGDCVTVCGPAEICAAGRCSCTIGTACGGRCVDTENDPVNCGACGHDCEGGGCATGHCEPVEVFDGAVTFVATDATHVYFGGLHALMRAPLGSTSVEKVADLVGVQAGQIALDATTAYFADPFATSSTGNLLKAPKAGGATTILGTSSTPWAVAVSSTNVYWGDTNDQNLWAVGLDGSNAAIIGPGEIVGGVAANATHVFWCSYTITGGRVTRTALDGSDATILAETPDAWPAMPSAIALDGAFVYWGNSDAGGDILRVPIDGGASEVLATTDIGVWGMAVDADRIYFTDGYYKLSALPLGGGAIQDLVTDPGNSAPRGVALSATSVYWAAGVTHKLRRVAKP